MPEFPKFPDLSSLEQPDTSTPLELNVEIETGDLLLFSRPCTAMDPLSAVICMGAKTLGWTHWDHIALVVENPKTKHLYLLEANAKGVTMHLLQDRLSRTKAHSFGVRKLIGPKDDEFREKLFNYASLYKDNAYSSNFAHFSMAMIMSYISNFSFLLNVQNKLNEMEKELHIIQEELNDRQGNPLFGSTLLTTTLLSAKDPLERHILKLQDKFDQTKEEIEATSDKKSSSIFPLWKESKENQEKSSKEVSLEEKTSDETNNETNLQPQAKEYFCSQLVAEILINMNILSDHRLSTQYIPADFSSVTQFKGLYSKYSPTLDSNTSQTNLPYANKFQPLPEQKSMNYFFSPEIEILKRDIVQLEVNDLQAKLTINYRIPKPIHPTKMHPSYIAYNLSFHAGDIISQPMIDQLIHVCEQGEFALELEGSFLILTNIEGKLTVIGRLSAFHTSDMIVSYLEALRADYGDIYLQAHEIGNIAILRTEDHHAKHTLKHQTIHNKDELNTIVHNHHIDEMISIAWSGLYYSTTALHPTSTKPLPLTNNHYNRKEIMVTLSNIAL